MSGWSRWVSICNGGICPLLCLAVGIRDLSTKEHAMADLEARVTTLERELDALKERQAATDADVRSLPELVKLEHKFTNTRIDRLARDVGDLKIDADRMGRDIS